MPVEIEAGDRDVLGPLFENCPYDRVLIDSVLEGYFGSAWADSCSSCCGGRPVPMGLTQRELAKAIHVPYQRINEIVNGRRGITPSTALRLAKFFGVSADFWMNLQLRWDLYFTQRAEAKQLERIRPYAASASATG